MASGWTIGDQRVSISKKGIEVVVEVDGVPTIAMLEQFLGEWSIPLAGRTATFRRVRNIDVVASELWVDRAQIPPSGSAFRRGLPKKGAACPLHERGERYREADVRARYTCAECDAPRCPDCLAPDAARCEECFARATHELDEARAALKKGTIKFVALAAVVILALGAILESPHVMSGAGGLVAFMLIRTWDARRRARRDEEELARRTPEQRALFQEAAEIRARWFGGGARKELLVPESVRPPAFGPYLRDAVRIGERIVFSAGTPLPAKTTVAIAPTARDERDLDLELEFATFRASALRPLAAEDRVAFTIAVETDGTIHATAEDATAGTELRIARVDRDEKKAPIAYQ